MRNEDGFTVERTTRRQRERKKENEREREKKRKGRERKTEGRRIRVERLPRVKRRRVRPYGYGTKMAIIRRYASSVILSLRQTVPHSCVRVICADVSLALDAKAVRYIRGVPFSKWRSQYHPTCERLFQYLLQW